MSQDWLHVTSLKLYTNFKMLRKIYLEKIIHFNPIWMKMLYVFRAIRNNIARLIYIIMQMYVTSLRYKIRNLNWIRGLMFYVRPASNKRFWRIR